MTRVWITRAQPGADRTAEALRARGLTPLVAPVLRIEPLPAILPFGGGGSRSETEGAAAFASLAFTSVNGVTAFATLSPDYRALPVFTVGDRTAQAARDAGFTDVASASGDARDLAILIAAQAPNGAILNPGAETPAADLSALLPGRTVTALPVYRAVETGQPAPDFDIVLIHSPRAARACARLTRPQTASGRMVAAISEAAAAPLSGLGFARVAVAARPDEASLLAAFDTLLGKPPAPV